MSVIVGISGKRGAGKDLLGSYLTYHGFKLFPFAGELKDRVRRDFNLSKEQTDGQLKEKETKYLRQLPINPESVQLTPDEVAWTPRQIMIAYGQFFRQFDELYWVKKVFERVATLPPNQRVAVTDVRFRNEADYIKSNGGVLVRLERKASLNIYKGVINDPSETELDNYNGFDLRLSEDRNETPQDLEKFAYNIVEHIQAKKG